MPESDSLSLRWYAVEDDTIGGWCVMRSVQPPSQGGYQIANFISQEIAEHIANVHNQWLEIKYGSEPVA
jgi:hypothetical protein